MKIVEFKREKQPAAKLIGKCYHKSDADAYGSYGAKWGEWFQNGWFDELLAKDGMELLSEDYIGLMRTHEGQAEYWIGILFAPDTPVPEGLEGLSTAECDLAVCYVYGSEENGEIYSDQAWKLCGQTYAENGLNMGSGAVFMERYNCPRFTTPDDQGNVILDICMVCR